MSLRKIRTIAGTVNGWTTQKQATKYVKQGRAVWLDGNTIKYCTTHQAHMSALMNQRQQEELARWQADMRLDLLVAKGRRARPDELRNLPVVGPLHRLLTERKRKRRQHEA